MIRRIVREWGTLRYGSAEDPDAIPEAVADKIASIAKRTAFSGKNGDGVLEHGRRALRARGIVGVVATPECQLEILPKIDGQGEADVSDTALRRRLIHMLAAVYDLPVDTGPVTELGWQNATILELLIRLFCARLTDAVRKGMPRRYVSHEDDLPVLRGRLDVTRQFSAHAAAPHRLACRFDELSPDIGLNQVMRAAVVKLARVTQIPDNGRALRELACAYDGVADVPVPLLPWEKIALDRTNGRWKDLLAMARMFLADRHQETIAGASSGYALLFEMHVLFERYIARCFSRALSGTGLSVSSQGGHRDCLFDGERGRFRTMPDLIVRRGAQPVLVIDTKWKRIEPRSVDPKQGVSQSDVYQLMAYARLYRCPNVMLLYPHHGELTGPQVSDRYTIASPDGSESFHVATVDLTRSAQEVRGRLRDLAECGLQLRDAA
jgi:5-methylcytosine-specific restriction enzyme subunit McrC